MKTYKDKFSALHYASYRGNIDMCKALLDRGADMKATNEFGQDVMHIAS